MIESDVIQQFNRKTGEWFDVASLGEGPWRLKSFAKPEPTWRPWKSEEVPVGAQVRAHGPSNTRRLIIEASRTTCLCSDMLTEYEELFNHHEHSLDNGKTWQPCGVLE